MATQRERRDGEEAETEVERRPRRVRLPGFVTGDEVGLGDVIKRATSAAGVHPCGGCSQRAAALNRWMVFTGRRK
jgi:hypothetical protein